MATTKYDVGDELFAVQRYGVNVVNKIKVGGIAITKDGVKYIDGSSNAKTQGLIKTRG